MDFEIILQNLKKKIYHPVYLLQGEEPYFIDVISDYIEKNVLTEEEKSFNQTIFYGKDSDPVSIAESALRYPMMSERQVIIVKEAQSLKEIEEIEKYTRKPLASTILVINYKYKKLDARTKLVKSIKQNGVILTTKKVYDNKLPAWIENYLSEKNYSITTQAAQILTAHLGANLSKVARELDKLTIAVGDAKKITPEHIEKNIGLSKDYNIIELQNALGERNILKANQIINYFGANSTMHPIQRTTAGLFFFFSKLFSYHFMEDKSEKGFGNKFNLHPFIAGKYIAAARKFTPSKLYEIIGILREYDMKSKGVGSSGSVDDLELQKEMIYKILH